MKEEDYKNSFTIGTPATGGSFKIYFEDIHSEQLIKDIDKAIKLWKNCQILTGKVK